MNLKNSGTADQAVSSLKSGMRVFVHGAAATPTPLLEALVRNTSLRDITLYHLHTTGPAPFVDPPHRERFRSVSLFAGPPVRSAIEEGAADFMPVFLSDIPMLFLTRRLELDAALLQLSPPDAHGYCTLGTSVDAALAAAISAKVLVAEINEQMPRTLGNTLVPLGEHIANLVDDGATLQMGIGAIPDAALRRLGNKHDLGVHTEMFSDGIIDLVENGVITNRRKAVHPGRMVTSFVLGSERLYRSYTTTPSSSFIRAIAPTTPRSFARTSAWSPSTPRSRSTCPDRSWPTRSASAYTPASVDKWISFVARRFPPAANRSSPCRLPQPRGEPPASWRRSSPVPVW